MKNYTNNEAAQIKFAYKELNNNNISISTWWEIIGKFDNAWVKEVLTPIWAAETRLKAFCNGYFHTTKIRKYCSEYGYSDVHPFEVVEVISEKCVVIRALDTVALHKGELNFEIGGFSAICTNQGAQRWEYISNPSNSTQRIHKSSKGWKQGKIRMSDTPYKFYDFNF